MLIIVDIELPTDDEVTKGKTELNEELFKEIEKGPDNIKDGKLTELTKDKGKDVKEEVKLPDASKNVVNPNKFELIDNDPLIGNKLEDKYIKEDNPVMTEEGAIIDN